MQKEMGRKTEKKREKMGFVEKERARKKTEKRKGMKSRVERM